MPSSKSVSAAIRDLVAEEVAAALAPYQLALERVRLFLDGSAVAARPAKAAKIEEAAPHQQPVRAPRSPSVAKRPVAAISEPVAAEPELEPEPEVEAAPEPEALPVPLPAAAPLSAAAKVAQRFALGQTVRVRGKRGLADAVIVSIDGETGELSLDLVEGGERVTSSADEVFSVA